MPRAPRRFFSVQSLLRFSLFLLLLTPAIQAQSVGGLQAPEKATPTIELPVRIKAARGQAPLRGLYDYLRVEPAKIKSLPALSAGETRTDASEKILRIGVVRALDRPLSPLSDGPLYRLVEGDVRVMGIVSTGALYTRVHFSGMSLPPGARVFVYSLKNPDDYYGPYEGHGLSEDGTFWTPPMAGEGVAIEYFAPTGAGKLKTPFTVSEISHVFKDIFATDDAGACNLEVTPEWTNVSKSVGMLQFVSSEGEALCTGTLLNDQASDQIPYLLTANHCFSTQTEAQSLRVYWNYASGDNPPGGTPFTDGANLLATGTSSDFTFVRLTGALPGGLFFSGWDANPTPVSTSVTGIHHPEGSHKRISFGTTNANCLGGLPGPCANFTHVGWTSGVTEPGSSGSGLWKGSAANAQLVGTLTAGLASCDNPTGNDEYGSFSATYPNVSAFLTGTDCVTSVTPASQTFTNGFGAGSVTVTAPGGCNWTATSTAGFVTVTSGASGNGNGTVSFNVAVNNGAQRSAAIIIGKQSVNITQLAGGSCAPIPITVGQTVNGFLHDGKCPLGAGSFYQPYSFNALAGQQISILMEASFDSFLFLIGPDGFILAADDDGGGGPNGTNSRIPASSGLLTLPTAGTYIIKANSFDPNTSGSFSLTLNGAPLADLSVSQSATNDRVAPGSKVVYLVTVTNNGGTTANSISVTDNLPAAVTFVSCGAADGVCGGSGNNRTITFASLAAGASATGVLIATVNNSVAVDTVISNTATVNSTTPDPNSSNNAGTAAVTVKATQFTSRSNGRIAFGSDRAFTNATTPPGFYTINSDGTGEAILAQWDPFKSATAWSPDGAKVAYGRPKGPGTFGDEILISNPDGTSRFVVAKNVFDQNHFVAWSPNGSKLAFIGTGGAIHVVNADGTGLSKLPNSPASVNDLSWSPDGSMFAYSNGVDVFVMNTDGSGQTNLSQGRTIIQGESARSLLPRWSPDGARLLFSGESNNYKNVYVMNADGSGLAPLITLHQSTQPSWSPDGQKITFVALNELYVANSNGTGATQITNNGFYNTKPSWQSLDAPPPTVQLSAAAYPVTEGTAGVNVLVTRTGFTSGMTTVDYATSDSAGANSCNVNNGVASSRCDYLATTGTLKFAANETSKTITIPIVDDSYAEGGESFTFTLRNVIGGTPAAPASATITITDNDATNGTNPIDISSFFVRQHYIDFLNREPDTSGLNFWIGEIENCTPKPQCTEIKRINVSAAFFLSIEFQETGYLVYRTYKSAYGNVAGAPVPLRLSEFLPDTQQIGSGVQVGVGNWQTQLENNKVAYMFGFIERSRFITAYPTSMLPAQFVDALFANAGVSPSASERNAAINEFAGATNTTDTAARGRALRRVAENSTLKAQENNKAFVLMQYFGYLRRNPNDAPEQNLNFDGYNFWLGKLNQFNGNFVNAEMVKAFILSGEYRQRFGP